MNAARDTADRIGIEVERDAALAEVVRLRGIVAEAARVENDFSDEPYLWQIGLMVTILAKVAPE